MITRTSVTPSTMSCLSNKRDANKAMFAFRGSRKGCRRHSDMLALMCRQTAPYLRVQADM